MMPIAQAAAAFEAQAHEETGPASHESRISKLEVHAEDSKDSVKRIEAGLGEIRGWYIKTMAAAVSTLIVALLTLGTQLLLHNLK